MAFWLAPFIEDFVFNLGIFYGKHDKRLVVVAVKFKWVTKMYHRRQK